MDHNYTHIGPSRELIRKAAHDVRTPLTSISGFAELLVEDESLPDGARDHAVTILDEAKRLSEMLESFFAKLMESETAAADED